MYFVCLKCVHIRRRRRRLLIRIIKRNESLFSVFDTNTNTKLTRYIMAMACEIAYSGRSVEYKYYIPYPLAVSQCIQLNFTVVGFIKFYAYLI